MYAYHRTEPGLWTVYDGEPRYPVSDHSSEREASDEAIRLNGGTPATETAVLDEELSELRDRVGRLETRLDVLIEQLDEAENRKG